MMRKLRELLMSWTIALVVYLLGIDEWGLSVDELGHMAILTIKILKPLVSDSHRRDLEEMEAVFAGCSSIG